MKRPKPAGTAALLCLKKVLHRQTQQSEGSQAQQRQKNNGGHHHPSKLQGLIKEANAVVFSTAVPCPEQHNQHSAWQHHPTGFHRSAAGACSQGLSGCNQWQGATWRWHIIITEQRAPNRWKLASTSALLSLDDTECDACNMIHASLDPVTLGSLVRFLACLSTKAATNTPSSSGGVTAHVQGLHAHIEACPAAMV